jgi:glutathione S-transferase
LDAPEGLLYGVTVIARFIAEIGDGDLQGKNAWEKANINSWIDFSYNAI